MPLVGEFHSFFWEDQGAPPSTPSDGLFLLLGVGRAVLPWLILGRVMFMLIQGA